MQHSGNEEMEDFFLMKSVQKEIVVTMYHIL